MPQALEMAERLNVQFFSNSALMSRAESLENGNTGLGGVKIFRAGTFKDSTGIQHTWEPEHLQQMVFNYNLLRDRGTFANVPVRDGHPSFLGTGGEVIGYITGLGVEDSFLVADFEITEPDALAKIERGTFRGRSSEVGYYETNDEAMYWPVLMGLAFVDIPAVEGLFSKDNTTRKFSLLSENKETPVPPENGNQTPGEQPVPVPVAPGEATPEAPPAGENAPTGQPNETGEESTPPQQEAQAQHGAAGGTFQFSINGAATNDFGAVQQHITALETAAQEQADQARREFVSSLASSNRVAATQVESLTAHALSLSGEQYATFRASFEAAPSMSLLGQHGNSVTNPNGEGDPQSDEVAVLEEIVANHRRAGMTEEKVAKTKSFNRLQELKTAK
jgi:hypothetical protein